MQNVTPCNEGDWNKLHRCLKVMLQLDECDIPGSLSTWWNKRIDPVNPRGHAGHQSLFLSPCPCHISSKISTNSVRRKITHRLSFPQVSWGGRATVTLIKMDDMQRLPPMYETQVFCDTVVGDVIYRVTSHLEESSSTRKEEPRSLCCYGSNCVFLSFFFN